VSAHARTLRNLRFHKRGISANERTPDGRPAASDPHTSCCLLFAAEAKKQIMKQQYHHHHQQQQRTD